MRRIVAMAAVMVSSLAAAAPLGVTPAVASGDGDDDLVTLTVGLQQDIDSPNVTAGYLVSSYEVWNLQYATLTNKAAADFAIIPGLAESWEVSDDGLTVTYTLREGLEWSDGEALTADDIAYTINRSRDEEWLNHSATTVNLDASALDDRTIAITSSVPDPKLPTMDVYIVPQHIYSDISAEDLTSYDGLDGVGSGPFVLDEWKPGEGWTMTANPNYYGWGEDGPAIDRVVFRLFSNGDAMAAALQQGEIDAAHQLPASSFEQLDADADIVAVDGIQGGFSELGINAGAGGIGDGNPALLDVRVRRAIAHAIDRDALFERVSLGLGGRGTTLSVSPDQSWKPEISEADALDYDVAKANALLDEAGYVDGDGDGRRETPEGEPFTLRYAQRTESENEPAVSDFVTGYLDAIGIGTTIEAYDDSQLTDVIGSGNFDLFVWGWTPFVDPDPMLSYFTCAQVTYDVNEGIGYNDANWCNEDYDRLYEAQKVELDPAKRREIVHEMLTIFYTESPYVVLFEDPDLQAYRTDRFEGWLQQPAEVGPVLFTNASPTYANLTLLGGSDDDGGSNLGVIIAIVGVVAVVAVLGGLIASRRRSGSDDRE